MLALGALSACGDADDDCEPRERGPQPNAQLVLSMASVDFGMVAPGSRVEATVTVEHTGVDAKTGAPITHDIGVGRLGSYHQPNFPVAGTNTDGFAVDWSVTEAVCPAGAAVTTQWMMNDRWDTGGWVPPGDVEPQPEGGEVVRIGPGCSLPLHLSFTAKAAGFHAASVVVETLWATGVDGRAPAIPAVPQRVQQVYLSATVPGSSPATTPVIGGQVQVSPDWCEGGEAVDVSTRAFDPDGQALDYFWGDDHNSGGFPGETGAASAWTCPASERGVSRVYMLFAVVLDRDSNQTWALGTAIVTGEFVDWCEYYADIPVDHYLRPG